MRLVGQRMVGFWLSVTVTENEQELVLPFRSVAVLVTIVVPIGKVLPLGGTVTTLAEPQLSEAATVKVTLLLLH